jgi:hypothetical protein
MNKSLCEREPLIHSLRKRRNSYIAALDKIETLKPFGSVIFNALHIRTAKAAVKA